MNTKVGRFSKRGMDDLDKCTIFLNIEINGLGHLVKLGITYLLYSKKEQTF